MSDVRLLHGDCLERMREMEASSVDAIATDPPYGIGFLGRDWDHGVPGVPFWAEALRVARPGAHLVAFGGTRTHHRLTCAIEDAGWEIRDGLVWLYGQGMPKSLDIGKAMDKAARAEREIVGLSPHSANRRAGTFARGNDRPSGYSCGNEGPRTVTAPATDLAKQWDGWGTGLKPSHEPIVLARKPLEGTVARNVAEHGCGGLNIDGCRIEAAAGDYDHSCNDYARPSNGSFERWSAGKRPPSSSGRWPANAILDEQAAAMLDAQAGERKAGVAGMRSGIGNITTKGLRGYDEPWGGYADTGGASRFFYCPKASPSERAGSTHPTMKPIALMRWLVRLITPPGGLVLDPFCGSGSTGLACVEEGMRFAGIDLSAEYLAMARARLDAQRSTMPLLAGDVT
jgi:DNA modification methylase